MARTHKSLEMSQKHPEHIRTQWQWDKSVNDFFNFNHFNRVKLALIQSLINCIPHLGHLWLIPNQMSFLLQKSTTYTEHLLPLIVELFPHISYLSTQTRPCFWGSSPLGWLSLVFHWQEHNAGKSRCRRTLIWTASVKDENKLLQLNQVSRAPPPPPNKQNYNNLTP